MKPEEHDEDDARARRAGRLAVYVAVYGALVVFILVAAADITRQLYLGRREAPPGACAEGLRGLVAAVDRARDAAIAASDGGEDAALAAFRAALAPEWSTEDALARRCQPDAKLRGALDAIERLRYAEEHAVRREAAELSPLRRRVRALVDRGLAQ